MVFLANAGILAVGTQVLTVASAALGLTYNPLKAPLPVGAGDPLANAFWNDAFAYLYQFYYLFFDATYSIFELPDGAAYARTRAADARADPMLVVDDGTDRFVQKFLMQADDEYFARGHVQQLHDTSGALRGYLREFFDGYVTQLPRALGSTIASPSTAGNFLSLLPYAYFRYWSIGATAEQKLAYAVALDVILIGLPITGLGWTNRQHYALLCTKISGGRWTEKTAVAVGDYVQFLAEETAACVKRGVGAVKDRVVAAAYGFRNLF
ncbi:hypothetical protein EVG20_g4159 [Dentipellis fragilis]|uniref:Uncharacterized protein n=1 Tax=Dentipellis fragilis TaxID=205917 RepID=A0A4Y9YXF0_9AGAM|nr:hypothetical protein EVG20_g4159 [Dentipellis fragilis]